MAERESDSVPVRVADGVLRVAVEAVMLVIVPTVVVGYWWQRALDELAKPPRDHGDPTDRAM
ncbi:hypothetical protein [Prauserella muralis]|uniref:Uncharacterized protein n=1 Tax=Prauserella muralis TaxID=588067 RepID=A0A2V4B238_9PSEU|nr:hypothetical protein [Prauserella muralis]PXY27448.1 hypothetical protein BAY60_13525 [Prauserella muralis]TWE22851.1 hypothetical protein FHX69_4106 [Prauserella muralis]